MEGNPMEDTYASCCAAPAKNASSRLPAWATRNRLMIAGGVLLFGGAFFNWGWLVAIGVAPILLAVAPCAIMCALGLCMMGMKKTSAAPTVLPTNPLGE